MPWREERAACARAAARSVTTLLLDAGVWLASLDTDDRHHVAARRLIEASTDVGAELAALDLTLYEVANVAVVRWRSRTAADRLVQLVQVACPGTLVPIDGELAGRMVQLAAEHGLTAYDAAYVAAAERGDWTLVSGDMADLVRPGHALAPDGVDPAG